MNTWQHQQQKTTCRRGPTSYLQQQQQQQQKHAAAAACCRSNKQHQAPTSTSAAYPALLGTRWNQRHHNDKIALIFSLSSSSATTQNKNEKKIKKSDTALVPTCRWPTYILHAVAPCQRLTQTDLASCRLRISITTTPAAQSLLHSNDQGKVQP